MLRRTADVIIPVYRDAAMTWACIESVLELSGEALGQLILVDDRGPEPEMLPMLRALRDAEPRVRLLENEANLGFVASCNRGLSLRRGHAVVLNSDTRVTKGWLAELLGVLDEAPQVAAVCPLSNNATLCSVPDYVVGTPAEALEGRELPLGELPRWTAMPTAVGFCLLLRGEALDAVGLFDPAFGRGYHEENDWCQRAQAQGLLIARANRAFVFHLGGQSFGGARAALDLANGRRLLARYPWYLEQNARFDQSPHARLAAVAVRSALGKLRLHLDATGASADVAAAWHRALVDDGRVALVPAGGEVPPDVVVGLGCPEDRAALARVLQTPAHLVLTCPPLSGLRSPGASGTWADVEARRSTAWAAARVALALLARSGAEADDAARTLGVPRSRVVVASEGQAGRLVEALIAAVRAPDPGVLDARVALAPLLSR